MFSHLICRYVIYPFSIWWFLTSDFYTGVLIFLYFLLSKFIQLSQRCSSKCFIVLRPGPFVSIAMSKPAVFQRSIWRMMLKWRKQAGRTSHAKGNNFRQFWYTNITTILVSYDMLINTTWPFGNRVKLGKTISTLPDQLIHQN